ncbi:MAG TPA: M3 family oligoendopeptidase [Candidatus Dormibacteraeota bacterium]|jgi:oligoendopeptidase F|nr:M3 family oligoendopeptidase [Candidatus Dormibacteraeota bacterium]
MELPASPDALADATWEDVAPYYEALATRPLNRANVEAWLADWSLFESLLSEAGALAGFAYSCDTSDPAREAAELRFGTQISPRAHQQRVRLQERLVQLDYVRPGLETMVERFRNQMRLFAPANVPLFADLSKLETEWSKVNGAMTVAWDGEQKTPSQLLPFLESNDRSVRERAFKMRAHPYIERRGVLAGIFDQMYDLRQQVARNAGFANYRDYAHLEKNRFDYTPDDCLRFHEAVESAVLPAVERVMRRRRSHMGVDPLRPWDIPADPQGRPPLKPFKDIATFIEHAGDVFAHVDPQFSAYYRLMADADLLDLDNRKGKAPGGYCQTLAFRKMPLIFMNAVGVDEDVRTLLHESGHAFHSFEASALPLLFQRHPGSEMAEVASMSMELLAMPFIDTDNGGYYREDDAVRSRADLLEGIILFFPHCASVDAFQHWIYLNHDGRDADARDRKWLELRRRFEGSSVDWSGLDPERIARWYQQPHFFGSPFYYIEYGIAQLGALQVWRNSLRDPQDAIRNYRGALALGATKPLPELFKAAGARLMFDSEGMRELISVVEEELAKLHD